jgi:polar amino acid transport system permease protein
MSMPFYSDYLDVLAENGDAIWDGLVVTLQLLLGSCAIGFLISIPLGIARATASGWLRNAVFAYSSLFRGTPLLVQIFIFYYGLSQFDFVQESFLWPLLGDSFYCGLVVLTLSLSAYTAENVRAGIMAVPPGEVEAARAYGLTTFQLYRYIIVPQALRIITPVLGNDVISQMKSTALVSTITVIDLTGVARRLSARTYTTDALVIAAIIYALIALLIASLMSRVERYNRNSSKN